MPAGERLTRLVATPHTSVTVRKARMNKSLFKDSDLLGNRDAQYVAGTNLPNYKFWNYLKENGVPLYKSSSGYNAAKCGDIRKLTNKGGQ